MKNNFKDVFIAKQKKRKELMVDTGDGNSPKRSKKQTRYHLVNAGTPNYVNDTNESSPVVSLLKKQTSSNQR